MKIHELLARLDDSEIAMQGLNNAITNISVDKSGISSVTFKTDAIKPETMLNPDQPCLILLRIDRMAWIREKTREAEIEASGEDN